MIEKQSMKTSVNPYLFNQQKMIPSQFKWCIGNFIPKKISNIIKIICKYVSF